jgi:glutathione S-transferase
LKLYDCATAPSPRRVRIFAAEKGIELEKVAVDLARGDQFSAAFREVNPDCVVPVLELDDGTRISEVLAICQYLEERHPEPTLFGRSAEERALTTTWNARVEQQGLWAMAEAFRNAAKSLVGKAIPGPDPIKQIPELAVRGRKRVEIFLAKLDRQLEGREFIVGDLYSIADISAMVVIDFAAWIKISIPGDASNLTRWYEAVSSRPSANA